MVYVESQMIYLYCHTYTEKLPPQNPTLPQLLGPFLCELAFA